MIWFSEKILKKLTLEFPDAFINNLFFSLSETEPIITEYPCAFWILVAQLCIKFRTWFQYPVWIKGEALRQILVNRYYGNIRPSGRRESLTSFGNGPLSPGGPSKPGGGGRLCGVLTRCTCELVCPQESCVCLSALQVETRTDAFVAQVYFWATCFVTGLPSKHWSVSKHVSAVRYWLSLLPLFPMQCLLGDFWMTQGTWLYYMSSRGH